MNLLVLLDVRIAFGLVEIIIFQLGALILGFSIHFFFASRKSISSVPEAALPKEPGISEAEEWRLKYYDEVDDHQKERDDLKRHLKAAKENEEILSIEIDEIRKERRKELVKKCQAEGEHSKVAIRNIRRDSIEYIKKLQKDGLSEDAAKDAEKDVQTMTDRYISLVDKHLAAKEKEMMAV